MPQTVTPLSTHFRNNSLVASPRRDWLLVLVVLEEANDIAFLRTISTILHKTDWRLPDLGLLEEDKRIAFVPIGGGASDITAWANRLDALSQPRFVRRF